MNDAPPTTDSPRWQRRPQARPEEILAAAMRTFVEKGYAATRLDTVAQRAGVSKGTLYLYFDTKEALFQQAVKAALLPTIAAAEKEFADDQGSPLALLRRLLSRWAQGLADPVLGGLTKLMIAEAANFPDIARFYVEEVVLRIRRIFLATVERAMAAGELRPLPAEQVVRSLTTAIMFAAVWQHSLAPYDPHHLDVNSHLQAHLDIVLQGLLPRDGYANENKK